MQDDNQFNDQVDLYNEILDPRALDEAIKIALSSEKYQEFVDNLFDQLREQQDLLGSGLEWSATK